MKRAIGCLLVLLCIVGCAPARDSARTAISPDSPIEAPIATLASLIDTGVYGLGLQPDVAAKLDTFEGATVYKLDFKIDDDLRSLRGSELIHYTNQEDVALDAIYLRLFPNLVGGKTTLGFVTADGQEVEPLLEYADSAAKLILPQPLEPGKTVDLDLSFWVEVPTDAGGSYGLFVLSDGVLALDAFLPLIPVYDDEGWKVEIPAQNADVTYYDMSFFQARITAPNDLVIATTGVQVEANTEGDQQIINCVAGPARDFFVVASKNYVKQSETVDGVTINSYAPDHGRDAAKMALETAADALRSFESRFAPYPYTELDLVYAPMQALGMEYPGIISMAPKLYDLNATIDNAPVQVYLQSVAAHEVAHQWFYNLVGSDQVDEPWIDEALAQYATWCYYLDAQGPYAANSYKVSWTQRWNRVEMMDKPIGLPVKDYEGKEYGAIVYGRGPLFFEQLAKELGQETVDAFLRAYVAEHAWEIATTASLKAVLETTCNCDTSALFEKWVYAR